MNTDTIRLGLPWKMSHYRMLNGPHPLVRSFIEGNAAISYRDIDRKVRVNQIHLDAVLRQLVEQSRCLPPENVGSLISALNIPEQLTIEADAANFDCLYLHTSPMYAGTSSYVFHFESFQSLFLPYVLTGDTRGADLLHSGYSSQIRNALHSKQCIRIFSHMKDSLATLRRVFDGDGISAKSFHIPLGIHLPSMDRITAKFRVPGPLRILFTNSLHQDPNSFYLRGGHLLLDAFARLRKKHPDAQLTILSSIPADLLDRFDGSYFEGVNWLQAGVSDQELEQLFLNHHVFALPAAGLHSLSLLRALAHGCIPIVSDALGYDEYLSGIPNSTLKIKGIFDLIYRDEPGGWTSDSYKGFSALSESFVIQIHEHLESLAGNNKLESMAIQNYLHCRINHDPAESTMAFLRMLTGKIDS